MEISQHPLAVIGLLAQAHPQGMFTFLRYESDNKLYIDAKDFYRSEQWSGKQIVDMLTDGHDYPDPTAALLADPEHPKGETGIVNTIEEFGATFYFPMVDFKFKLAEHRYAPPVLRDVQLPIYLAPMQYYASGISAHGYIPRMIMHGQWVQWMGGLLLSARNAQKAGLDAIDQDWIALQLLRNRSTLRISGNVKKMPVRLAESPVLWVP